MSADNRTTRAARRKPTSPIGRPPLLRRTNALTLLKLLREAGTCSRADLVRNSGMSAPTVTNVVADLLAADLVQSLGEGESSGGRPPDLIRFKAERGCLMGVRITAQFVSLLLADLSGRELDTSQVWLPGRKTAPDAICALIAEETRRMLKARGLKRDRLLALVVGVPAITNVDEGVVLAISTLEGWRNVRLRPMLKRAFPCHVVVENDHQPGRPRRAYGRRRAGRDVVCRNRHRRQRQRRHRARRPPLSRSPVVGRRDRLPAPAAHLAA